MSNQIDKNAEGPARDASVRPDAPVPPAAPALPQPRAETLTWARLARRALLALLVCALVAAYLMRYFDADTRLKPDQVADPFRQLEQVEAEVGERTKAEGGRMNVEPDSSHPTSLILRPSPLPPAPDAPLFVRAQCLDYLGELEYEIFGKVFGRTLDIKSVGTSMFYFTEQQDPKHGVWYDIQFHIRIADPLVALFTFQQVSMHAQTRLVYGEGGARMTPLTYSYELSSLGGAQQVKRVLYKLEEGAVFEKVGGEILRTAVSADCYDPISHIVNTMNRSFEQFEAGMNEQGLFKLGMIYVERESDKKRIEEEQWASVHPAEKTVKMIFSERAFPGGGRLVFTFRKKGDAHLVDNTRIELEYGRAGGVLEQRKGRSSK